MPKSGLQATTREHIQRTPGKGLVCPYCTQDLQLESDLWKHVETAHSARLDPLQTLAEGKTLVRDVAYVDFQPCMRPRPNGSCSNTRVGTDSYQSGMPHQPRLLRSRSKMTIQTKANPHQSRLPLSKVRQNLMGHPLHRT